MPSPTHTDSDLLRRYVQAQDQDAFGELANRYVGLVYTTVARKAGFSSPAIEDITQSVFTTLARKAGSLVNHTSLAGWLHLTARYQASKALRAERRRKLREQETYIMQQMDHAGFAANTALDWSKVAPVIDEALEELESRDREIVLLRFFANLPHAQLGNRLAISEDAARMRIERALNKLHDALTRRGITSTASALGLALSHQAGAALAVVPAPLAASVAHTALVKVAALGAAMSPLHSSMLSLMVSSKTTALFTSAIAVLAVSVSIHQYRLAALRETTAVEIQREQARLQNELTRSEQRSAHADRRAVAAELRAAELQRQLSAPRPSPPPPNRPVPPNRPAAVTEKLAQMKPLLEAGQPIKGGVVVFVDGKAVTREVGFVIGTETRIEGVDDGVYLITPALNADGTVKYQLKIIPKEEGKPAESLPSVTHFPWGGFSLSTGGGKIFAFDPDEKGPMGATAPAPSHSPGPR